jgi:hypothetical protein
MNCKILLQNQVYSEKFEVFKVIQLNPLTSMLNVNKYVRLALYTKNHISKFVIPVKPHHPKSCSSEKKKENLSCPQLQ